MNIKFFSIIFGFLGAFLAGNAYCLEPVVGNDESSKSLDSTDESSWLERNHNGNEAHPLVKLRSADIQVVWWEKKPNLNFTQAELEGKNRTLLLNVEADKAGIITKVNVKQSTGLPKLDEKAIAAVKAAKLKPHEFNGNYYSFKATLPFQFFLDDDVN